MRATMTDPSIKSFIPPNSQPAGGQPAKPRSGCGIGCAVVVGLVALSVLIGFLSSLNGGGSDDYDANNKYEAIARCEERVKALLKAPATAEFDTDARGSGTWTVSGTVDSENSFGAMLRTHFQCTVVIKGTTATTTVDFLE